MARENKRHLFRMEELDDYKVASNEPDVRGWDIVDYQKEKIGVVRELIVDIENEKVRYLDVVATADLSLSGGDRHFIIPIGVAHVDENENRVIVREIDKTTLASIPNYTGAAVTRDYEFDVVERLRGDRANIFEDRFYDNEFYNEENFYLHKPNMK